MLGLTKRLRSATVKLAAPEIKNLRRCDLVCPLMFKVFTPYHAKKVTQMMLKTSVETTYV